MRQRQRLKTEGNDMDMTHNRAGGVQETRRNLFTAEESWRQEETNKIK